MKNSNYNNYMTDLLTSYRKIIDIYDSCETSDQFYCMYNIMEGFSGICDLRYKKLRKQSILHPFDFKAHQERRFYFRTADYIIKELCSVIEQTSQNMSKYQSDEKPNSVTKVEGFFNKSE